MYSFLLVLFIGSVVVSQTDACSCIETNVTAVCHPDNNIGKLFYVNLFNFAFCFIKINFFQRKIFQEHYQGIKWFGDNISDCCKSQGVLLLSILDFGTLGSGSIP